MKVCIKTKTQRGKVAAWVEVPIDLHVLKKELSMKSEYEDFEIIAYTLPFKISKKTPISTINERARHYLNIHQESENLKHYLVDNRPRSGFGNFYL